MKQAVNKLNKIREVQLIYKKKGGEEAMRPVVTQSQHAHDILRQVWDENRIELLEDFKIILLNRANMCLGVSSIATGGVSVCPADSKIIFATALKANASSLILAHNHPSGNLKPSQDDINLTQKMVQAGKVLDIDVFDHIIMTANQYYSFADNGLVPKM